MIIFSLTISISPFLFAQLGTAGISGTISDPSGAFVPGARVTVRNISTGQSRTAVTDATGTFKLQNLSPTTYEVKVEAGGFALAIVDRVEVRVGEIPTVNISLKPKGVVETVQISASEAVGVDTTTSQVSSSISDVTLASLPLNGRNFLDLAFLLPGNRPAPNFDPTKTNTLEVSSAGQLGRGGNLAVDGADNNDDVVGGTLQNFPQDAVQEFQIITNRFSADIGRSASSAVNIITKSGTNTHHGAAGFYFRNDALSALPATLDRGQVAKTGRPSFDREQYAGSLGGPIYKDSFWYFTAFEYRSQDAVVATATRDLASKTRVIGTSSAPLRDTLLTGRIDWDVSANDRMAFRYALERENDIAVASLRAPIGSPDQRQQSFNKYQSFVYNWTHTFSPSVLNEFVFHENNFENRIPRFVEGNDIRFPSLHDGGSFRVPQRTPQNRIQIRDNVSWNIGKHAVKFGGEFQNVDAGALFDLFGSGTIILTEDFASIDRNSDGKIDTLDIPIDATIKSVAPVRPPVINDLDNKLFAFYVQNDWKVRPSFTLNIGLRYELDTNTKNLANFDAVLPFVRLFLNGQRERDKNNFSPRIGFNWDVMGKGKFSLRGGYGIYYDRVVLEVPLLERLLNGSVLRLEVRGGSKLDATGKFLPGTPTLSNPFTGPVSVGAGAVGINLIPNNLATPYVQQFNFGFQVTPRRDLVISADAIHSFGSKFIIGRPIGSVINPIAGGPDGIVSLESSTKNWFDGLLLNVQKRQSKNMSFIASYTLSKSFNFSNDDQIPFQVGPLDPSRMFLEKGPPPNDERHRFTFGGVFNVRWGIELAPIYILSSGVPYDIQVGGQRIPLLQRNAAGRQFNTGLELNNFLKWHNSTFASTYPLVRDDLKLGDAFQSFDLRLTKIFKLNDRVNIRGMAEVFNVFNITNVRGVNNVNYSGFQNTLTRDSDVVGSPGFMRSSSFGAPVQIAGGNNFGTGGPRSLQLAVRFQF